MEHGFTQLQARFRGNRERKLHLHRVKENLVWSPYIPSKPEAIQDILRVANIQSTDVLIDIGSGDGRVLIEAAKQYGIRCIGYELDPCLVELSRKTIATEELTQFIQIVEGDWMSMKEEEIWSDVTIVFLFFLPHEALVQQLKTRYRPGTRVITSAFPLKDDTWKPEQIVSTIGHMTTTEGHSSSLYIYKI